MVKEENWRGAARMTVSNVDVEVSPVEEEVVMLYVPSTCFEIVVTVVFRCVVVAEDASSICAKMRQFPPSIAMAPLVAIHTIVSRPWMSPRLDA
jgi:hypothetical protein